MAFEMTHMRFARDVAHLLDIKDLPTYLAGSVYPDSRYVTGIDRNLTHGVSALKNPKSPSLDDFHKGWAVHEYYDHEALDKYKALSPWPNNRITSFGQEWIFTTAEKIVEDLISQDTGRVTFDLLKQINPPVPINQEDPALLETYYLDIKKIYANKPTLEDYRQSLLGWHIEPQTIALLITKVEEQLDNPELIKRISEIYPEILKTFLEQV